MSFFEKITKHVSNLSEEETSTIQLQRTDQLSEAQCELITNKVQEGFKSKTYQDAFVGLCLVCQQGGTAKKCDGNLAPSYKGISYKLATIRKIFQDSESKGGAT